MTEYIVVAAACGVPTGKENPLTRLPDIRRFTRGQVVDSAKFDTEQGRDKIERLLRQGALRDPDDIPQAARVAYQSDFDIPLDRDPGERAADPGVIRLPGDDIEDDGEDDTDPDEHKPTDTGLLHPAPTEQVAPSLVDGTPEARLAGEPVVTEEADTSDESGDSLPEPPSRGASTAVWQQYAERAKLGTAPDASRSEIQEAYDARVQD